MPDWKIGPTVGGWLVERFGFVDTKARQAGYFRFQVDGQHWVWVMMTPWPNRGYVSTLLGVARRDINELWSELIRDRITPDFPTVRELPTFWGRDRLESDWSYGPDSPEMVSGWVDEWIPLLIDSASLSFVVDTHRERADAPDATDLDLRKASFPLVCDALLSGFTDADYQRWVEPWIAESKVADEEWSERLTVRVARIEAWAAAHPDGIDRELAK